MTPDAFGTLNAPYIQFLYEAYLDDPASVGDEWRRLFDDGLEGLRPDRSVEPEEHPGSVESAGAQTRPREHTPAAAEELLPLRGAAARIVTNMTTSLSVPTATSYRQIQVSFLEAQRRDLNRRLREQQTGRKISFTHVIGYAVVRAASDIPAMTHAYREIEDEPHRVDPHRVNLGIAVDIERKDGSRSLVVPVIRDAGSLDFAAFLEHFDDLVQGARRGTLMPDAYMGANITLTNPGTIGTHASVPRLMAGQGTIVATGAIGYPAGFGHLTKEQAGGLDLEKVMTVSSTYDHRVIQGAESGLFLQRIEDLLRGGPHFYEDLFDSLDLGIAAPAAPPSQESVTTAPGTMDVEETVIVAAMALVKAFRHYGHRAARLDPLGTEPPGDPALDPSRLGLPPEIMAKISARTLRLFVPGPTLREAFTQLRDTYCGSMAYEVEHIANHEERVWLREMIESGTHRAPLTPDEQTRLLAQLTKVDVLERFLHRQYMGHKRFGIEGLDMLVPMLAGAIDVGAEQGMRHLVMGMAHRGRLNVLTHIIGIPYETLLAEFEGGLQVEETLAPRGGTGDVKYHHGAEGVFTTPQGKSVTVSLSPNPSHLEAVDPVVQGRARAGQTQRRTHTAQHDPRSVLPVLIHGDAAFAAQGVVAETFNLERLEAYSTGGTLHFIANNQVGFTTNPSEGRSTDAASDLAKGFDIPVIHVNADDAEACMAAVKLAMVYRAKFKGDVLINLVGYRRHGHNEGDEPSYTQPLMYERIKTLPTIHEQYSQYLIQAGTVTADDVERLEQEMQDRLTEAQQTVRASESSAERGQEPQRISQLGAVLDEPDTSVPGELLRVLNEQLLTWPETFNVHPKLKRQFDRRRAAFDNDAIDWAHAEVLALASLLTEGVPIRLTGQDVERGTFSQRHLTLHDIETGATYSPLQHLPGARAAMELHNGALSEYGALGFEYGYAADAPESLVLWEAQFGDFANGAEVIIDQFIIAGLAKWGETSRLTLLLPHGYEGQGPEHSSARLERYLALGAEGNIRVANCTTPAQYFHLLRRQGRHRELRPLIVMTPKSLLRLPLATSELDELTNGAFQSVLDDPSGEARREDVTKLILCTGKVYYDLLASEARAESPHAAVGRVELLYPFPAVGVAQLAAAYPNLERVSWVQEEPDNMGARKFVVPQIAAVVPEGVAVDHVSRPERSSPAEGYPAAHTAEQQRIVLEAYS